MRMKKRPPLYVERWPKFVSKNLRNFEPIGQGDGCEFFVRHGGDSFAVVYDTQWGLDFWYMDAASLDYHLRRLNGDGGEILYGPNAAALIRFIKRKGVKNAQIPIKPQHRR